MNAEVFEISVAMDYEPWYTELEKRAIRDAKNLVLGKLRNRKMVAVGPYRVSKLPSSIYQHETLYVSVLAEKI